MKYVASLLLSVFVSVAHAGQLEGDLLLGGGYTGLNLLDNIKDWDYYSNNASRSYKTKNKKSNVVNSLDFTASYMVTDRFAAVGAFNIINEKRVDKTSNTAASDNTESESKRIGYALGGSYLFPLEGAGAAYAELVIGFGSGSDTAKSSEGTTKSKIDYATKKGDNNEYYAVSFGYRHDLTDLWQLRLAYTQHNYDLTLKGSFTFTSDGVNAKDADSKANVDTTYNVISLGVSYVIPQIL